MAGTTASSFAPTEGFVLGHGLRLGYMGPLGYLIFSSALRLEINFNLLRYRCGMHSGSGY